MNKLIILAAALAAILANTLAGPTTPAGLPAPITDADYHDDGRPGPTKVELGRLLFFDKILSGNRNISCATCHHPRHATSDGVALAFGEGARGLGPDRRPGITPDEAVGERVPRNSPALFNLGAREYTTLFHDGRVEIDEHGHYESGFISPARWKLPTGLESALAAQAMFPVTSPTEMAGQKGENDVADARSLNRAAGTGGVWDRLAGRLRAIPEYVDLFRTAYPDEIRDADQITFVHAANAIAAFEAQAFRADKSAFDAHLRGERDLNEEAKAGMELFYGRADCARCHAGKFQTDHEFHAIAMPQIGPGKGDGRDSSYWSATGIQTFVEDFGRERTTGRPKDRFKFRTPSLRNVELTGPWGHAGAYTTLEAVIRHHLAPVERLNGYDLPNGLLPSMDRVIELSANGDQLRRTWMSATRLDRFAQRDGWVQSQAGLRETIAAANELPEARLTDHEVAQLIAFLESLTDPRSRQLARVVPARVPSGLPVED